LYDGDFVCTEPTFNYCASELTFIAAGEKKVNKMRDKKTVKDAIDILKGDWSEVRSFDYVNCGWGLVMLEEYFRGNPKDVLNIQYDGVAICDKAQFEDYIEILIKDSTEGYYINTVKDAYENLKGEYRENSSYKFIVYNKESCSFSFYTDDDVEDHLYVVCSMKELIEYANNLNNIKGEDMKTVEDAYEYNNDIKISDHHTHICFNAKRKDYFSLYASDAGVDAVLICTIKQYKDYAIAQKNKINKETVSSEDEESKSDTPVYTQQKTVLMEESLKCIIDHLNNVGVGGVNQNYHGDYDVSAINELASVEQRVKWIALNALDLLRIDTRTDEEKLIDYAKMMELNKLNKEAVKPVYTQEMADNGEFPPVGSNFICEVGIHSRNSDFNGLEVEVTGVSPYSTRAYIITYKHGIQGVGCGVYPASNDWIKPIDTRTDEEKLIDEVAELINDHIDDDAGSRCLAKEIINKLK